ncbi:redox-regulated ATPase YchF [Candidatus Pacearchaeota archaeon]|nr:MAG: redox-regulated ATPase YchF [Candidatus Pacearchaeota archaeon]
MVKIGLVGLPNVGKTTFFNILTSANAEIGNFPFTTIDKNIGVYFIKDKNLEKLAQIFENKKIEYPSVEIIDIAGLVEGAHNGVGLGNRFLAHIREVDLIIFILRGFERGDVPSVMGNVSPLREYEILELELIFSDLEIIERRYKKANWEERVQLDKIKDKLSKGEKLESIEDIPESVRGALLSIKPSVIIINTDEDLDKGLKFKNELMQKVGEDVFIIPFGLYKEILESGDEEFFSFLEGFDSIDGVVRRCLKKLGYIICYTVKGEIAKGWIVRKGINVYEFAGKIHSDIQKGFIKAKIYKQVSEKDFIEKIVGRDYIIEHSDIIKIEYRV